MHESLSKVLRPIDLWAIAVGLASLESILAGVMGLALQALLGFCAQHCWWLSCTLRWFFQMTELTTAIPHAGGPFVYVRRAFGSRLGCLQVLRRLWDFCLHHQP